MARDLDIERRFKRSKDRWKAAEARAKRLGYPAGLSPQSISLYRDYMDCYCSLIATGERVYVR